MASLADHPFVNATGARDGQDRERCGWAKSQTNSGTFCWRLREEHPEDFAPIPAPATRRELVAEHIHRRGCTGCAGRRHSGEHKTPGRFDLERADALLVDLNRLFGDC